MTLFLDVVIFLLRVDFNFRSMVILKLGGVM